MRKYSVDPKFSVSHVPGHAHGTSDIGASPASSIRLAARSTGIVSLLVHNFAGGPPVVSSPVVAAVDVSSASVVGAPLDDSSPEPDPDNDPLVVGAPLAAVVVASAVVVGATAVVDASASVVPPDDIHAGLSPRQPHRSIVPATPPPTIVRRIATSAARACQTRPASSS
jgi:hypothetical protein